MTGKPYGALGRSAIARKSQVFVVVAALLGFAELVSLGFNWQSADSRRFIVYLLLTFASSFIHLKRSDRAEGYP